MKIYTNMSMAQRGFTLIELLVVIAIIGILSAVVLASLNTARNKGADAAIKSNINNMRSQAEISYDNNNSSYVNVCIDAKIQQGLNAAARQSYAGVAVFSNGTAADATHAVCHSQAASWAATSPLKTNAAVYYCVDSTGNATTTSTALPSSGGFQFQCS